MTTALSANRRNANEVTPFHAPQSLFENLQAVLAFITHLPGGAPDFAP